MRFIGATSVLSLALTVAGCQTPVGPGAEGGAIEGGSQQAAQGVQLRAAGGGHYTIPDVEDVVLEFAFSALVLPDGSVEGNFHHRGQADGALIDFRAKMTCLGVDSAKHRAWLGGVITENRSTHPGFTTAIHQVGRDIWFRVQDNDAVEPTTTPDVTTIVGFESLAIPTSQFYCDTKPWRDNNVWPVRGNLTVTP